MSNSTIVRTPTEARGGITEEERAAMVELGKKYVALAFRTEPIVPDLIIPAIHRLYEAAKLPRPKDVHIVPSPRAMAILGGTLTAEIAAAPKKPTKKQTQEAIRNWHSFYQRGNFWADRMHYIASVRDVLGLKLPAFEAYAAWEECGTHGSFRYVHKDFCVVSDFPERLCVDEQHRPHSEDGPALRWRDGLQAWYWHGVEVNEQLVMAPETLTYEQVRDEKNAEVRRVMIERRGEEWYIEASGMRAVAHDEAFGTLYHEDLGVGTPICKLRVINSTPEPDGTFRIYWLSVNPDQYGGDAGKVPQAAAASTWRKTSGGKELLFADWRDYRPAVET